MIHPDDRPTETLTPELRAWAEKIMTTYREPILAMIAEGATMAQAFRAAVDHDQAKTRELLANETGWAKAKRAEILERVWVTARVRAGKAST